MSNIECSIRKIICGKHEVKIMREQTFEEIVYMIKSAYIDNLKKCTDEDKMNREIIRCATDIYIAQINQMGVYEN